MFYYRSLHMAPLSLHQIYGDFRLMLNVKLTLIYYSVFVDVFGIQRISAPGVMCYREAVMEQSLEELIERFRGPSNLKCYCDE